MPGWLTWANGVTALRVTLIFPSVLAILFHDWTLAAALFILVALSDTLDGWLARTLDQATPLGGLFDHATDAVYVSATTWAASASGLLTPWLAPLIMIAFVQYALDSKALKGEHLRTSRIGRLNGVAYFVLVGIVVASQALEDRLLDEPIQFAAWLLVASSIVSIIDRAFALIMTSRA
jgi:CDP-diacylglycerol--glycerol-3-phosphate 3-phosphatidyltransferase